MVQQTEDLETIVVDSTWKRQGLVVAVADNTPLIADETENAQKRIKKGNYVDRTFKPLARLVASWHPYSTRSSVKRILSLFPNVENQVTNQDLRYFASAISHPVQLAFMLGVKNPRVILDRNLEPHMLYAAIRDVARESDDKTLTFVYVLAHSNGQALHNTALSKFGITPEMLAESPALARYADMAPEDRVYQPADISQRLSRGKGATILYVDTCSGGNLFDGMNLPPRTIYIATSDEGQLSSGLFGNSLLAKWVGASYIRTFVKEGKRSVAFKPGDGLRVEMPPFVMDELERTRAALGLEDNFPAYSDLRVKGNIMLVVERPFNVHYTGRKAS